MQRLERLRSMRAWQFGAVLGGMALVGLAAGGVALGAASPAPSMSVLPSATGVKYKQTVEVKGQNLPKASGSIAVTICGLNNAAGTPIASPGANDCAGANDLSSGLVKLQTWKDGTFDQQYTLPASGQKFGTNQRFCDATHYCALAVADANPSAPAYYITTELQFTDQKPVASGTPTTSATPTTASKTTPAAGGSTTPSTAPPTSAATPGTTADTTPAATVDTTPATDAPTTTTAPGVSVTGGGSATAGPGGGSGSASIDVTVTTPSGSGMPSLPGLPSGPVANPIPPQAGSAVTQACAQLAQVIQQGGADPSALTTACSTLVNGGGGAELQAVLQSPSLGCIELSSLTQNNAQLEDACSQLATALAPYSGQLGTALTPILGLLP